MPSPRRPGWCGGTLRTLKNDTAEQGKYVSLCIHGKEVIFRHSPQTLGTLFWGVPMQQQLSLRRRMKANLVLRNPEMPKTKLTQALGLAMPF